MSKVTTTTREPLHDIDDVCKRIANGESLRSVAADYLTDHASLLQWIQREDSRSAQYQQARLNRAHKLVDEIVELSDAAIDDPVNAQARKLQIDTRKWVAGKLYARVYGDKMHTEVSGTLNLASALSELAATPIKADE